MDYLKECVRSLLKFNNDLDSLILYPNELSGDDESSAINIQKILNRNSEKILQELKFKIEDFDNYSKEEKAFLIVFYGDLTFSDNFNILNWERTIDSTEIKIDKEKLKKNILSLV